MPASSASWPGMRNASRSSMCSPLTRYWTWRRAARVPKPSSATNVQRPWCGVGSPASAAAARSASVPPWSPVSGTSTSTSGTEPRLPSPRMPSTQRASATRRQSSERATSCSVLRATVRFIASSGRDGCLPYRQEAPPGLMGRSAPSPTQTCGTQVRIPTVSAASSGSEAVDREVVELELGVVAPDPDLARAQDGRTADAPVVDGARDERVVGVELDDDGSVRVRVDRRAHVLPLPERDRVRAGLAEVVVRAAVARTARDLLLDDRRPVTTVDRRVVERVLVLVA